MTFTQKTINDESIFPTKYGECLFFAELLYRAAGRNRNPSWWRVKSICGIPRLSRLYHIICVKKREMFQSLHSLLCTNMPRQQHNSTAVNFLAFPCLESDYFCMRPQSFLSDHASILRSLSNKL
jgi:hypothetical protein